MADSFWVMEMNYGGLYWTIERVRMSTHAAAVLFFKSLLDLCPFDGGGGTDTHGFTSRLHTQYQTCALSSSLSGAWTYPWSHGGGDLLLTSFTAPAGEQHVHPFMFKPYDHFERAIHILNNQKVRIRRG